MMGHRSEMLPWMPGKTAGEKDRNFLVIFSTLLGAVSFARMLPDAGTRRKILGFDRRVPAFEFLKKFITNAALQIGYLCPDGKCARY